MEGSSVNSMCRCCASEGASKDIKTSYHWMGEEEVYADMIRECFEVTLSSADQGGICEVCITQLRNAANFKKQVLNTESQFKQHLRTKGFKGARVKEELSVFDDNDSDDMDNGDDEDYIPEYEVPIKTESESEDKPKKRSAKTVTTRAKKSKSGDRDAAVKSFLSNVAKMDIMKGVKTKAGLIIKRIETEPGAVNKPPETKAEYKQVTKLDYRLQSAENAPTCIVERNINRNTKARPRKADLKFPKAKRAEVKRPSEVAKHRFNIRMILQCSNATPIRAHYVGNGYACSFCDQFFLKAAELKTHTLEEHDVKEKAKFMQRAYMSLFVVKLDITALCCNLCEAGLDTLDDLITHLNQNHNVTLYTDVKSQIICFKLDNEEFKCMFCEAEFSSFKPLLEHMNRHYTNYVCDTCGAGFITERMLGLHSEGHKQGRFECGNCKKVFNTLRSLKYHQRTTHAYPFRFKCFQCNKKFATLRLKKIHMTEFHGAEFANLPCLACDRTFKDKKALNLHTQRDHLKRRGFECDVCGKRFYTNDTLKGHMVVHLGLRDFTCDICGKDFIRKKSLVAHMLRHIKEEGRFMCKTCDQKFLSQTSLDEHNMQYHIGE